MSRVFIDSGAFIAFLVRRDRMHDRVRELFSGPGGAWFTSVLVISETYGWFLLRAGEDAARTFRELLDDLPTLEILDVGSDHLRVTFERLDRLRGAGLTLVDASSLVRIDELGISTVWGTDPHLGIEGAQVVPGPP